MINGAKAIMEIDAIEAEIVDGEIVEVDGGEDEGS